MQSTDGMDIDIEQARTTAKQLEPHIWGMLDAGFEVHVVLDALGEAFIDSLRLIGANSEQLHGFSLRRYLTPTFDHSHHRKRVAEAFQHIGPKLRVMLTMQGVDPLIIAWALAGVMGNIVSKVPGLGIEARDQLGENLIMHIRAARAGKADA